MLVIFSLEFITVQKLHGHPYGDTEGFPGIFLGEWSMGQFAEAAIVGFGAHNLVSQVDEPADRVAVGIVDKDKCHWSFIFRLLMLFNNNNIRFRWVGYKKNLLELERKQFKLKMLCYGTANMKKEAVNRLDSSIKYSPEVIIESRNTGRFQEQDVSIVRTVLSKMLFGRFSG